MDRAPEIEVITSHHDGLGLNDLIRVEASDKDANGVPHRFDFYRELTEAEQAVHPHPASRVVCGYLQFQHGPRNVGTSRPGLISDAVYAALIHVMEGFQRGPFASAEGGEVLSHLTAAAEASRKRARERAARGVLGHNKA